MSWPGSIWLCDSPLSMQQANLAAFQNTYGQQQAQDVYQAPEGELRGAAARERAAAEHERWRAAQIAEDKRQRYMRRFKRMSAQLEWRREQIRAKWVERAWAAGFLIIVPPVAVFVFAWLWRLALGSILN